MNIFKTVFIAALALLSGCCNLHKVVRELAKDPATASFSVTSIYGTVNVRRANPVPGMSSVISPDGTLQVSTTQAPAQVPKATQTSAQPVAKPALKALAPAAPKK